MQCVGDNIPRISCRLLRFQRSRVVGRFSVSYLDSGLQEYKLVGVVAISTHNSSYHILIRFAESLSRKNENVGALVADGSVFAFPLVILYNTEYQR